VNETKIAWATRTLNVVHGCSKPAAVPAAGLKIYEEFDEERYQFALRRGHTINRRDRHQQDEVGAPRWGTVYLGDFDEGRPLHKWTKPDTSPECARCYAETLSNKRGNYAVAQGRQPKGWTTKPWTEANAEENVHLHPERFKEIGTLEVKDVNLPPSQRERIFICSMGDIFHRNVPTDFLRELFAKMWRYRHIYMVLTKRPERALELDFEWPDWVWLGTTVGHPVTKWRMEYVRRSPAKTRFVSMEPLLQSMTDSKANAFLGRLNFEGIHQVIVGGESGSGYRPMEQAWARQIRDVAKAHGTAFFYKQDAAFQTERRTYLVEENGMRKEYRQYPGELTPPTQVFVTGDELKVVK
jgi:protein gp37